MAENKIVEQTADNAEKPEFIHRYFHEAAVTRLERHLKWLWIAVIILISLLVATNSGWLWYESQFQDEVITLTQEASTDAGGDAVINGTAKGDVNYYGQSEADNNDQAESPQDGR